MIGGVIADLAGRVTAALAVEASDETISVTVDSDGDVIAATDRSATLGVRVLDRGRIGFAGGHQEQAALVVESALRSAEAGDPLELILPAPSPVSAVITRSPRAAHASEAELLSLARSLRDRLRRDDLLVEAWAERSAGGIQVGNTRGVLLGYDVSLAGLGATVVDRRTGTPCRAHLADVELPGLEQVELLVGEITDQVGPPLLEAVPLGPSVRVWFRPRAVRALLKPFLARLAGERWVLRKTPVPPLDPALTLWDDPLVAARPGSRPIDDDGVVTRRLTLIDKGHAVQGVLDLATAARYGLPATGHGWHRGLSAPGPGFSNLVLEPGRLDSSGLGGVLGTGLVVAELAWGPAPNPEPGVFRVHAPWCFLMEGGEIVGRLERAILSGNVFDLLNRVVAVGADPVWIGAASLPSVIVDGVGLGA